MAERRRVDAIWGDVVLRQRAMRREITLQIAHEGAWCIVAGIKRVETGTYRLRLLGHDEPIYVARYRLLYLVERGEALPPVGAVVLPVGRLTG